MLISTDFHRGVVEGATESFRNTKIDITSEQAKDIQVRLFLPHLECESVLLHDKKHLVYSYLTVGDFCLISFQSQVSFHILR